MASYGALVSLLNTLEQIEQYIGLNAYGGVPFLVDKAHIQSLSERVTFLIDFLERHNFLEGGSDNKKVNRLENRIRDAAYAAIDCIGSNVAKRFVTISTSDHIGKSYNLFCKDAKKMTKEMDSIKKMALEIEEMMSRVKDQSSAVESPQTSNLEFQSSSKLDTLTRKLKSWIPSSSPSSSNTRNRSPAALKQQNLISDNSSKSPPTANTRLVGFDEHLIQLMDWLMGQHTNLLTIPIVGMGGIGKTTLSRNVYDNPSIVEYFYRRAWVTVSQEYNLHKVLSTILYSMGKQESTNESLEAFIGRMSVRSEDQLGEELYKSLCGMRYLIVVDDLWSVEAWDKIKCFFPDNGNGSRILLTTRLSNVASYFSGTYRLDMNFLDEDKSWSLLQERAFGRGNYCPPELVEIGKTISRNCGGLPLSLVVIGGLLAKSKRTLGYWKYVAENVKTVVNLENDGQFLRILSVSYNHLPIHLKPCFLYLSAFPEDQEINVSRLIKSWVSEGFLKPNGASKTLEEIAKDSLKELIDRNLVLVHKRGSSQNIKTCKIHDLLRELCLKEAHKEKFRCEESTQKLRSAAIDADKADMSCTKILGKESNMAIGVNQYEVDEYCKRLLVELVNFRFIDFTPNHTPTYFSSIARIFWNLQTLIIRNSEEIAAPSAFWEMPQLRHVKFKSVTLPDPPSDTVQRRNGRVLKNLQTLLLVRNFKCSEAVIEKIPHIKKLQITYDNFSGLNGNGYRLNNLGKLCTLESLSCSFGFSKRPNRDDVLHNLVFPSSLKRLILHGSNLLWEDIARIIGSLPNLEVLKLCDGSFRGTEWNLCDGADGESSFVSLKFLMIERCNDLVHWNADETHFPSLVTLVLRYMNNLEEIPSGFGDIPTLQFIKLEDCSDSTVVSAKNILEYQQSFGIEDLQVQVLLQYKSTLEISTSKNFFVRP